jgi:hypothetical protein
MSITITDEIKQQILAPNTFLCGFRGSLAHNMYIPGEDPDSIDDVDLMSVYVANENYYIGLGFCSEYNESGAYNKFIDKWDSVSYEVRKFFRLLIKSNPNVLSLLWLKDEFYIIKDRPCQLLIENRNIFTSKEAWNAFRGYAKGQFHRMISPNNSGKGYMGEKRRRLVEKFGFDTKNAAHMIRLLRMGIEMLDTGVLNVYRTHDRDELLAIKKGKWSLDQVIIESEKLFSDLKHAGEKSSLPDLPDVHTAEKILKEIINCYMTR